MPIYMKQPLLGEQVNAAVNNGLLKGKNLNWICGHYAISEPTMRKLLKGKLEPSQYPTIQSVIRLIKDKGQCKN